MTREQILEQLDAAGYVVARRAYCDAVHAMHPLRGAGTWDRSQLRGRQYSIDLATGLWNRWGDDGLWHPLSELPRQCDVNREATPSATSTVTPEPGSTQGFGDAAPLTTFVDACLQAGFVLDDDLVRSIDFGNRFARWTDGRRYLLHESAGKITDCLTGDALSLDEFSWRSDRPRGEADADLRLNEPVAPSTPTPPPRPFISMRERPLTMQGATVQTSLF